MKWNWFYLFVAAAFGFMLWISQHFFAGSAHSSVGVTFARPYEVNVEKQAQVKKVSVVTGQQVKAGDLLIELTSSELQMEIDKLGNQIKTLRSEQMEKAKLAISETAYAKAEVNVILEELNTKIKEKESELKLNQELTIATGGAKQSAPGPLQELIASLKQQRERQEEALAIKLKDIQIRNEAGQMIMTNQSNLLERELEMLQVQKKNLNKYASAPGVVETVFVKEGEEVDAYTVLLTVNPDHPTSVIGYLVGRKDELPMGAEVHIRAYDDRTVQATGKVIGYGSMMPLPEILQKSTAVKAFGQEVFIEMERDNHFAAGEKVLIR